MIVPMDAIEKNNLENDIKTSPETKLLQAIQLMASGFQLKRAALTQRTPGASDEEVEAAFLAWLRGEDDN